MTPETKKISSQKATALLRKEGKKTADLTDGGEIVTSQGVVLKEGGTYYLTTEPKPVISDLGVAVDVDALAESLAPDADTFIETTTKYLTKPGQTFVEPKREAAATAPLSSKAEKFAYSSGKQELGIEARLFKGFARRRKSRLLKRVLRAKNQGKALTAYQLDILASHAQGCKQAAQANRGF